MKETKEMLEDVIRKELEKIEAISDGEKKQEAIDNFAKLYRLKIEEDEKGERRVMDQNKIVDDAKFNEKQSFRDRIVKICIAAGEIILPLTVSIYWMKKGFEFEQTGTITSTTFKWLTNRFKLGKK